MSTSDGMEEIRIIAPVPGTCRVCAARHTADKPHDLSSLYYKNRFWKEHHRFPTREDAMSADGFAGDEGRTEQNRFAQEES